MMYETNLDKNNANFTPLSPLSFLERTAGVYPDRKSIIHGNRTYTWSENYKRSRQLASALSINGIGKSDTVSVLAFNTPEIYEAHFAVPMIGAVLNTINIRLDVETISYILSSFVVFAWLCTDLGASTPTSRASRCRCQARRCCSAA